MENSSVASASSEAGSTRSQEIEELERFIDSYVLEYQVQGLLSDKNETDADGEKTQSHISQWTEDCSDKIDGSWSSSRGRGSTKPDDWEHSSNGSTGSRPSSGSRPGSGSRSGSRGKKQSVPRPSKERKQRGGHLTSWARTYGPPTPWTRTAGRPGTCSRRNWTSPSFHRKPFRGTPKHLPHIDREGMMKGKFDDDDAIDLNDMEKFLPGLTVFPPLSNEAEIAHTKKLFRRRRNDRRPAHLSQDQLTVVLPARGKRKVTRRQQRIPGGAKSQNPQLQQSSQQQSQPQQQPQHPPLQQLLQQQQQPKQAQQQNAEHPSGNGKYAREHGRPFQGSGPHPSGRQGQTHHGYSQNRRWHHNQKHQPAMGAPPGPAGEKGAPRNTKETENVKAEEPAPPRPDPPRPDPNPAKGRSEGPNPGSVAEEDKRRDSNADGPKVNLLQSSKERLRRRLKEKDDVPVATTNPQRNCMDKLMEILNGMRSNSSAVDGQLTTFMEEAQNSTNSEEMLSEIVHTIYQKAVSDRSFASTAAKLCDKMALFMVEGTKFRSLLLNMLQKDFTRRDELQLSDVERWLGFITFLCEVFGIMRSSDGEPYRVLVCPIYTCLRELLESAEVKEDAVLCCSMELQSTGRLLEEQLPEMMTELLAAARDKMLCPSESQLTRSLLMEVIELHAHQWSPLEALTVQYYNRTIQKLTA
ncbi:hypothetical protein SKAU_G00357710 [Synaphobranchus kaupii]|uniref:CBP80/20-dependent translation initiation factor n=1 Tax=Synaphobranchus kaupii TaxID=118154 RepID=A0A9Q1IFS6_SYNKA|nr:hypothetical protein SKAU_G00357710 [Synaphobranchus kaupii]